MRGLALHVPKTVSTLKHGHIRQTVPNFTHRIRVQNSLNSALNAVYVDQIVHIAQSWQ